MMFEATTIYAFWENRREGFEATARRMAVMLRNLAPIHPAFRTWQWDDPVSKQLVPYGGEPPTIDGLVEIFKADRANSELDRDKIPGAGFSTRAWNGGNGRTATSFRCSLENIEDPRIFPNLTTFTLPSRRVGDSTLICAETLTQIISVVASAWDAVWASTYPKDIWEAMEIPPGPLRTGWITYLSAPLARRFVAPPGCRVEPGPADGLIVWATDAVFDPENPEHLAIAREIQAALDLIQPPNPNTSNFMRN